MNKIKITAEDMRYILNGGNYPFIGLVIAMDSMREVEMENKEKVFVFVETFKMWAFVLLWIPQFFCNLFTEGFKIPKNPRFIHKFIKSDGEMEEYAEILERANRIWEKYNK